MPESGMPATPPPAAPIPESATTALYRAALGPVNTAHYLAVFERFDEAGRASPVWNAAAGLLSINWMVFRQLWGMALAYVLCVGGLVGLAVAVGLGVLQWPPGVAWGVLAALLLLSIAIPGAYGNALLHADTRRRITHAVRAAKTVREACRELQKQASSARRRSALVWINAALLAASLAAAFATNPHWRSWAQDERVAAAASPAAVAAEIVTEKTVAAAPAVEIPAPTEPQAPAVAEVPVDEMVPPPAEPPAPPAPQVAAHAGAPAGIASQVHGINVGLFADKANAERAHARLVEAGIPAILQTVESPKGERTRVRVGPFGSRAQADKVAARIRALGLDAVVFRP